MKSAKLYVLTAIIFNILFFSCKKDSIQPGSPSFSYFPTEKGKYVIYEVDSVYHADNDNNTDDSVYSTHFQLKEVIGDSYFDGEGRLNQVIKRYRRDNDTLPWDVLNVWTQVLTNATAYKTEDNVPYHKLGFPINDLTSWNGNDANTLEEELYEYQNYHVPLTLNGLSFDSTLSVLQRNDNNFVFRIYAKEIFANHVGLIYKERDDLHLINSLPVKGTEFKMKVKSYGVE